MVGSKDLPPSTIPFFPNVFFNNQFRAKPQWPAPGTSLAGKTAIITGGNTGLGYEAAAQLLELKLSYLILAVRTPAKGEAAARALTQLHPKAKVDVWELEMSSYESIQAFARRVDNQLSRIDIVVLNAGTLRLFYSSVKSTSHEECLQVNYLSTMLLTVLLIPILKGKRAPGQPAHLTIVSAALTLAAKFANREANPLLPALDDPKQFDRQETYNTSKLLAHFFLWNLVDCVSPEDVIVNLADPAWCKGTELARDVKGVVKIGIKMFGALTGRTQKVGASCFVDAVVNKGKESHGCFLMSWQIHPFAAFLYTPEGKIVRQRVWEETMTELDFAGVRGILESMRA
ncbi:short-chain dehydrogenase/reductase family protein [Lophium mytilinum]|uniref:Short-chain dehydrogenase/reductase family protein n=1 Tax=Lophium mytilinum TaxID=390894 RepID=A0A6A6QPQ8_9PEZI|nr:short-chain dehydrogenase/reductase family protein [Lophium mytilinum]